MIPKNAKKYLLIVVGAICLIICAVCGAFLYQFYKGVQSETELIQQVKIAAPTASQKPAENISEDVQESSASDYNSAEETAVLPVEIPIDFAHLATISSDIYAWLEVPDTQIDEPVLQHPGDDLYYNSHNAYGEYYMCGAVFSQETYNDRTFDAPMTILYGHGTVLGQPGAFHELNNYADQDYFDTHRKIVIYTPSAMYVYRVFAAFVHGREHLLYYYDFTDPVIFTGFFQTVRQIANQNYSHFDDSCMPEPDDKVLALSTCFEPDKTRRYLVMGVLEEVHPAADDAVGGE